MKPKTHHVLDMCIQSGIEFGWNRAFKHDDDPSEIIIKEHIHQEIMNQIYEWFDMEVSNDVL